MNRTDEKYTRFALCREMLETPDVMRNFNAAAVEPLAEAVKDCTKLFMTGEGSSRIFPAKRAITEAMRGGQSVPVTEGATQALEYQLDGYGILGASNSGRTRELVRLFRALREQGHTSLAGLCAHADTPLEAASDAYMVLGCGNEDAVAATKSVAEQAMAWQALMATRNGETLPAVEEGAAAVEAALTVDVPEEFSRSMAEARTIFFTGRNDGVAEELTLKTNEIVRKTSDYLEGTYVAHGIEEIMREEDVIILVNPFPEEEEKIRQCIAEGVGAKVFAIASRDTLFPTLKVPQAGPWQEYVLLAAGWNLLVEAGIAAGINLDKPERARKVGNEID